MIPKKGKPILWEEMTWTDIDKFTKSMNMAITPTAACALELLIIIGLVHIFKPYLTMEVSSREGRES
jgi:hypothetical protein